jgi:hypothetical protein
MRCSQLRFTTTYVNTDVIAPATTPHRAREGGQEGATHRQHVEEIQERERCDGGQGYCRDCAQETQR